MSVDGLVGVGPRNEPAHAGARCARVGVRGNDGAPSEIMVTRQVSRLEDQGVNNLISRQEQPDEQEAHQSAASAHD
jgi:hypothetical protein